MYPKKIGKNPREEAVNKTPNILLEFRSVKDVWLLTKKLKDIKQKRKFQWLQFEVCVPPYLMPQWLEANSEGFKLRKNEQMITRTMIIHGKVELLAKKKRGESFTIIDSWKKKN